MPSLREIGFVFGMGAAALLAAGCGEAPKTESTEKPKASTPDSGEKPVDADPASTPESTPPAKPAETAPVSNKVVLGAPELTAGIPGQGKLTTEQIKAWLDKPENHQPLEVQLPLGLNMGRIPEGVLEANPLTRAKIELGRQLYFDPRLCGDSTVSCAHCHHPDEGYAKHTRFGVGIGGQEGGRNSPTSYNRILTTVQFWDGRAGSLEEQAKGPIANPIEMGNTHEAACATVGGIEGYKLQFDRVFPGEGVTIDNVAKAIASFERTIVTGPSPYDYYEQLVPLLKFTKEDFDDDPDLKKDYDERLAQSRKHPMSESALRGRELFFGQRVNCAACHVGANLADEKFHNLGIGMDKPEPDLGRFVVTKDEKDKGAFKTPTIRNVAHTAPYMHDGSLKTLLEVVEHYNKGGTPNPHLSDKMKKLDLTDQEKQDLVAFMEACTGEFPKMETGRLPE